MNNPFSIIFGVETEAFIPRIIEYQKVVNDFESISPVTMGYVITGIRGCGKTVLMTSIQRHFAESKDWFVLRLNPDINLFASAVSQMGEFVKLKDETLTGVNISIGGVGGGLSRQSLSDEETLLRKMLTAASKRKKRVLLVIDEASNTRNIKTFAHSYQAFIGEGLPVFLLMTALPENFASLSRAKNSTFIRRLPRIRLGMLSNLSVEDKYMEFFKLTSEQSVELAGLVKGYPYAFQVLGSLLWDKQKPVIDDKVLSDFDALLGDGIYTPIWEHLSEKERKVVCAIAESNEGSTKDVRQILGMEPNQFSPYHDLLKEYGLIDAEKYGELSFSLPRFGQFVKRIRRYY